MWTLEHNHLTEEAWALKCETAVTFASELFGKKFASIDDLRSFLSQIRDHNEFFSLIQNRQKLVSQDNDIITPEWLSEFSELYGDPLDSSSLYEAVIHIQSSFRIDSLIYNGLLGTIPVTT